MRNQTLSILLSDLQGYTERQARSTRAEIARDLAHHGDLLRPVFATFGGEVVKSMGDAFLVAFESPTSAVLAAVQVQKQLAAFQGPRGETFEALRVRIGIATGEVSRDETGDVFGNAVNLAARLQTSAEPGAVWLDAATFLSMNRNEVQAFEVGARVFKGIAGEVKVYRVLDEFIERARTLTQAELAKVPERRSEAPAAHKRRTPRLAVPAIALLALLAVVLFAKRDFFSAAPADTRTAEARHAADPRDPESADAWMAELTTALYDAEDRGAMPALYREGVFAQRIQDLSVLHGERPGFRKLQAVYLMANEPLAPGVPDLVARAVATVDGIGSDARFRKLLESTVEYAAKEPEAQVLYRGALERLLAR